MLLFYATFSKRPFADGPLQAPGEPFRLYPSLYEAEKAAAPPSGSKGKAPRFLALDAGRVHLVQHHPPAADQIPAAAAVNLDEKGRIVETKHVEAAGGLVLRIKGPTEKKPERRRRLQVLLIFRRGTWDLPKGKLDPGEHPVEGGHREVCEEVGIKPNKLEVLETLGETVHGYPHKGAYAVKTTHWFAMQTTQTSFTPEAEEDIERVAWCDWDRAADKLGYDSLRDFLRGLDGERLESLLGDA
jgi:8-oxo-dGTP pyrophosphatase MutT (NUDIX family)